MTYQAQPVTGGFDVALRYIDDAIMQGRLKNGDRLPPERELAAEIGVSRGAVREAIRVQQTRGVLISTTGPGNGTRVQAEPVLALARIVSLHLALGTVPFADLTEARVALERAAVVEAAKYRRQEALQAARVALEQMEHTGDARCFNETDTAFHMAIIEAGDNALIRHLTSAIREAAEFPIKIAEAGMTSWVQLRDDLVIQHRALLEAVEQGDAAAAAAQVEAHIRHAFAAFTA